MRSFGRWSALFAVLLSYQNALAAFTFNPSLLNLLSVKSKDALIQTAGIGADMRAYSPATPLGESLGFDLGVDVTLITLPQQFSDALALIGNTISIPQPFPLPRLNIHKGLPGNVDIGFTWVSYLGYSVIGGDAKWCFSRSREMDIAVRASYTMASLSYIETSTITGDVVISFPMGIINPYLGAGVQEVIGALSFSILIFPIQLKGDYLSPRVYAGIPFKLSVVRIVGEIDYNTAGVMNFGGKFSFMF